LSCAMTPREEKSAEEKFCLDSRAQGEAERFKQKLKQNATEVSSGAVSELNCKLWKL